MIIREHDCHADDGIEVYEIRNGNEMIEPLAERLVGRYLVEDLRDDKGELIVSKNKLMNSGPMQSVLWNPAWRPSRSVPCAAP